jgi:hypothetical protein
MGKIDWWVISEKVTIHFRKPHKGFWKFYLKEGLDFVTSEISSSLVSASWEAHVSAYAWPSIWHDWELETWKYWKPCDVFFFWDEVLTTRPKLD